MDELIKLLHVVPDTENKQYISISCFSAFEPHGYASETWEIVWTLVLNQMPYRWKSTTGWQFGNPSLPMSFSGRTLDEVIALAVRFLKEIVADGS